MSLASYHCSTPGPVNHRAIDLLRGGRRGRCGTGSGRSSSGFGAGAAMTLERPRRCEFAELMPHHVLGHEKLHELTAIMNEESVTDKVRHNRAIARPGFDRLAMAALLPL